MLCEKQKSKKTKKAKKHKNTHNTHNTIFFFYDEIQAKSQSKSTKPRKEQKTNRKLKYFARQLGINNHINYKT
jgi:hypothetical protein